MKIEYLREFLILADFLNFTAAAEHLFIAQPVLSRHMDALEDAVASKLFERSTRSVALTDAGRLFKERVERIVKDYDDTLAILRMNDQGYHERLRIGVSYYALRDYLGNIPERFETKYPKVKLQYAVGDPYEVLMNLLYRKVEIILTPLRNFPQSERYEFHELFEEPIGVLIARKDPLAKKKTCSLLDLKDKLFFSVDNMYFSELWQYIRRQCQSLGFDPRGPGMMNQAEAAIIAVGRGDGIITLGRHMRSFESDEIAWLELKDPGCSRMVNICCAKADKTPTINHFIKMFAGG